MRGGLIRHILCLTLRALSLRFSVQFCHPAELWRGGTPPENIIYGYTVQLIDLTKLPRGWHIGVDEAGRGCLAGPVVAGAFLAGPNLDFASVLPGLTDSKAISESRRELLRVSIFSAASNFAESPAEFFNNPEASAWGLGFSWPDEIDEINILNATFRAMSRAVCSLFMRLRRMSPEIEKGVLAAPHFSLYIDGSQPILKPQWQAAQIWPGKLFDGAGTAGCSSLAGPNFFDLPPQKTVVQGDSLIPSISAASILAKTQRDRLMVALDRRYPGYGFATHKGYGTKEHLEALERQGLCRQHRKSFGPCAALDPARCAPDVPTGQKSCPQGARGGKPAATRADGQYSLLGN
jgi:ribonuclease HII